MSKSKRSPGGNPKTSSASELSDMIVRALALNCIEADMVSPAVVVTVAQDGQVSSSKMHFTADGRVTNNVPLFGTRGQSWRFPLIFLVVDRDCETLVHRLSDPGASGVAETARDIVSDIDPEGAVDVSRHNDSCAVVPDQPLTPADSKSRPRSTVKKASKRDET